MEMISNNLNWFVGVVEDRMDPLKLGRVRVRVVGLHPPQRAQGDVMGIPTEKLPWMSVIQPITSAAMSFSGRFRTSHRRLRPFCSWASRWTSVFFC